MPRLVRLIGDVHGKFGRYGTLLRKAQEEAIDTIQVGDMGVGFRHPSGVREGDWANNPPYHLMTRSGRHRFIRGNHDNPLACKMHSQWITDGTIEDDVMFVGGGVSIDKALRIEGYTWWPDEELSTRELACLIEVYACARPRVMITHDCPEGVALRLLDRLMPRRIFGLSKTDFPSRTRETFEAMLAVHKPELWVFGHWHTSFNEEIDGVRFVCLPELETMDVEL